MAEIKKQATLVWVDGAGQEKRTGVVGATEVEMALLLQQLKSYTHAGGKKISVTYTFSIEDTGLQATGTGPYATVDQIVVITMEDKLTGKSRTFELPAPVEANIDTQYKAGKRMLTDIAWEIVDVLGANIPGGPSDAIGGGNWYLTGEPWLKSVK